MKIKHISFTNKILTVSENNSETGKLTLDKNGFATEELTDRQCYNLGAHPDFILCDDEGEPIETTEKVEKQIAVIDDDQNKDVLGVLKQANEKITFLESEVKTLQDANLQHQDKYNEQQLEIERLESENKELKAQLEVKTGNDADVLVEGQKKLEDGKAYIVKPNGSGVLQWYRDKENDPK
jgi:galactose mutarotase-like enzyme